MRLVRRLLIVVVLLLTPMLATAQTAKMQVIGTASVDVPATAVVLTTLVVSESGKVEDTTAEAARLVKAVGEAKLPNMKVEQRQVRGFDIPLEWRNYRGRNDQPMDQQVGVLVTVRMQPVSMPVEEAYERVQFVAIPLNAEFRPTIEWEDAQKYEAVAASKAVQDARAKAELLARAAGGRVMADEYLGFVPQNGGRAAENEDTGLTIRDLGTTRSVFCRVYLVVGLQR